MTGNQPDDPHGTLETLRFLSQTHRSIQENRIKGEVRAFYTTLTFYALLSASRFSSQITLPSDPVFKILTWVLLLTVAGLSCAYLWGLHKGSSLNRTIAENAENALAQLVQRDAVIPAEIRGKHPVKTKWWQFIIIFLFALASGVIITVV